MSEQSLIAVIEDDESLRAALLGLVRSAGYRVEGYASGEAFLDAGADGRAHCLVSDLQLPGLSGLDVKARLDAQGSSLPMIVITARTEEGIEKRARAAGVLCTLRKPFEADDLIACIERALDS